MFAVAGPPDRHKGRSVTAEEAMKQIGQILNNYHDNALPELATLHRISLVVGAYEGSKS